jgi:asparagine synthase (glutamine-hydrolysing)
VTGLIGTSAGDGRFDALAEASQREDWYEIDRAVDGEAALGVIEHGSRDPDANVVWRGDGLVGVVYGVVANRDRLSLSWGDVFRGVVDDSGETLARLDGPFALACVDTRAGAVHLATDRVGSRPLYYAAADAPGAVTDGIAFASELGPLVGERESPALDPRAVGDLLLFGGVVGALAPGGGDSGIGAGAAPTTTRAAAAGKTGSPTPPKAWHTIMRNTAKICAWP